MCDSVTGSPHSQYETCDLTHRVREAFFESCTAIGRGRLTVVPAGKKFPRYFEISTHLNTSLVHCITVPYCFGMEGNKQYKHKLDNDGPR